MNTHETRSNFVTHESLVATVQLHLVDSTPSWARPSRCKRPPLKLTPKPDLFDRLLALLGLV